MPGRDAAPNFVPITRMSSLEEEMLVSSELTDKKKLYRTRSCSERSDSGISDCSNHALTSGSCSCSSTPLLGKRFSINEEPEYKKIVDDNDVCSNNNIRVVVNTGRGKEKQCFGDKGKRFSGEAVSGRFLLFFSQGWWRRRLFFGRKKACLTQFVSVV